uniref:Uncharacterized protein n=1 Tax=Chromera velia CCMP2878 TaxID=1169474 RepID=A0A0G4FEW5_9ALVE|eukprot:Cvel_16579.t1-p1 / transcript=Cvel_16579.t1 / gene=Cvel_16579 / organism=Chromera_velia_CCMP2878 / gene_product=hypothetical protein / transcript_product=hypothetical protein / location=Cvel_scaffold1283:17084-17419(-) / protein_length=112 / sequence_SO=supercontig / SO=protein_coding / is_pseudo=false
MEHAGYIYIGRGPFYGTVNGNWYDRRCNTCRLQRLHPLPPSENVKQNFGFIAGPFVLDRPFVMVSFQMPIMNQWESASSEAVEVPTYDDEDEDNLKQTEWYGNPPLARCPSE